MHDVVRDMVLQIMGRGSLVEAGVQLRHFPDKEKWTEDLERVSLMDNDIEEIPTDASPRCSRLKTLLLLCNFRLTRIPDLFFAHMSALRVLDLSSTKIEILPDSVSFLRMLTALIARNCEYLRYVPSLAPLEALEVLDLRNTAIKEVPQGIEMLINLRELLIVSLDLKLFPTGILPKLSRLQRLEIHSRLSILKLKGDEVAVLCKLENLCCQFYDVDDFYTYIQLQQWRHLNRYLLLELTDLRNLQVIFREEGGVPSPTLPPGTFYCLNRLDIHNCWKIKQLFTLGLVSYLQNLEELRVWNCGTMEVIIAAEGEEEEGRNKQSDVKNDDIITICLPKLRVLYLWNLPNLKSIICRRGVLACDGIEEIEVSRCWNLKRFPISLPVRNGQPSPPPSLTKIETDDIEWWNSLEWDNPIVKDVLQSFVHHPYEEEEETEEEEEEEETDEEELVTYQKKKRRTS